MAHARRLSFPRTSGPKRKTAWAAGPGGTILGVTATSQNLFPNTSQVVALQLTQVRVRGQLKVWCELGGAARDGFAYAFGMCYVSENAIAAGIASVPHPLTDIGWRGWMVHLQGHVMTPLVAIDPADPICSDVHEIDNKSMRKVMASDTLIAVF